MFWVIWGVGSAIAVAAYFWLKWLKVLDTCRWCKHALDSHLDYYGNHSRGSGCCLDCNGLVNCAGLAPEKGCTGFTDSRKGLPAWTRYRTGDE